MLTARGKRRVWWCVTAFIALAGCDGRVTHEDAATGNPGGGAGIDAAREVGAGGAEADGGGGAGGGSGGGGAAGAGAGGASGGAGGAGGAGGGDAAAGSGGGAGVIDAGPPTDAAQPNGYPDGGEPGPIGWACQPGLSDCPAGLFCANRDLGFCPGVVINSGWCFPQPAACLPVCPGVCGCDHNVYCNECEANRAGTGVLNNGGCP